MLIFVRVYESHHDTRLIQRMMPAQEDAPGRRRRRRRRFALGV